MKSNKRNRIPAGETRRQKFERLLVNRVNKALDSIRLIGNLSSPNYQHSPKDVRLVRSALADEINKAVSRFEPAERKSRKSTFSLPSSVVRFNGNSHSRHNHNSEHSEPDQPAA